MKIKPTSFTSSYLHTFQLPSSSKRRFVVNSVYPGGSSMIAKILDFRLSENALSRIFCSAKLSLESWILNCLRENLFKCPPNITKRISIIVYLILQYFSWLTSYELYWFWNSFLTLLSYVPEQLSAFVDTDLKADYEDGGQEQPTHLILLLAVKIFT